MEPIPKIKTVKEMRINEIAQETGMCVADIMLIYDKLTGYDGFSWNKLNRDQKDILMQQLHDECLHEIFGNNNFLKTI